MYSDNIRHAAIVACEGPHYFEVGERVVIFFADLDDFYPVGRNSSGMQQVLAYNELTNIVSLAFWLGADAEYV